MIDGHTCDNSSWRERLLWHAWLNFSGDQIVARWRHIHHSSHTWPHLHGPPHKWHFPDANISIVIKLLTPRPYIHTPPIHPSTRERHSRSIIYDFRFPYPRTEESVDFIFPLNFFLDRTYVENFESLLWNLSLYLITLSSPQWTSCLLKSLWYLSLSILQEFL